MNSVIYTKKHKRIIKRLIQARRKSGLTQKEVARKLDRSQSYISKIESGQRIIDVIELEKFMNIYKNNRGNKKWGFRGMNSSKASKVKIVGHKTENILASLINVSPKNIIAGTGKTDLINKNGKRISLKSSHDKKGRSQICLYSYDSNYFKSIINGSTKRMRECLAVFPAISKEYQSNKITIKKLLQGKMIELQRYINSDNKNKKEFLEFIFFTDLDNKKIDFIVITDTMHNFHVFRANEAVDAFCKNTIVVNSIARHSAETPNLKVLFKGKNENNRYVNLIENEVRTSTHYRRFLSVGNKTKYLFLLRSNIKPRKVVKKNLILYGEAIGNFNF